MSIASQATQQKFPFPYDTVFDSLIKLLPGIGIEILSSDKLIGRITASTRISMFSWGENLTLVIEKCNNTSTIVGIESSLKLGVNLSGSHRHQKNFNIIICTLSNHLQSPPPPIYTNTTIHGTTFAIVATPVEGGWQPTVTCPKYTHLVSDLDRIDICTSADDAHKKAERALNNNLYIITKLKELENKNTVYMRRRIVFIAIFIIAIIVFIHIGSRQTMLAEQEEARNEIVKIINLAQLPDNAALIDFPGAIESMNTAKEIYSKNSINDKELLIRISKLQDNLISRQKQLLDAPRKP